MQNSVMLEQCGLMSPEEFHNKLDTGPYIGFANGVYDTARDVFMPRGSVGHNVLVSMTTTYAYVSPDDARVPRVCAEIMEYYATLFAADAADPNDELVRKARLMVGSYLYPCNYAKKLHVYLGHEGNNGKSAFAEFLRLTLGDY
jgi:phage/plasmid-associated DNA primase